MLEASGALINVGHEVGGKWTFFGMGAGCILGKAAFRLTRPRKILCNILTGVRPVFYA